MLAGLQSGDGRQFNLQQPGSGSPIDAGDSPVALSAVLQARYPPDASLSQLPVAYVKATERYDLRCRRCAGVSEVVSSGNNQERWDAMRINCGSGSTTSNKIDRRDKIPMEDLELDCCF